MDELTAAEKRYKAALEDVKGALGAGDVSQEKATADQVKATQQYIASLTRMQAGLSPTSDKFQLLKSKIDEARASLLKLDEGQEEYQAALDLTNAKLEAGIITQQQADAENQRSISDYITRLQHARGETAQGSAAAQGLTTKILQQQAAMQNTPPSAR